MDGFFDSLMLGRFQFAITTSFHILWAASSIGLGALLIILEGTWLATGDETYYRHARFWGRFFLLTFAVGVVTGIPLGFQFGTNWKGFALATGGFFGNLLTIEATLAFMLEATFLGVMLFGWNRVSRGMHFLSTFMVTFGASLSALWIMVANSWMQTPAGGHMENGVFVVDNYWQAIFNPDAFLGFTHMWVACIETMLFAVGGISAWFILKNVNKDFFIKSFRIAALAAVLFAPVQFLLGDASGVMISKHQPTKLAATEAHWETNAPGQPAGWNIIAWPLEKERRNAFEIQIPYGLSLVLTKTLTGQVLGMNEFPIEDQPPVTITFYAFRLMMGIGFGMIGLMGLTFLLFLKGRLTFAQVFDKRWLMWLWVAATPMGYLAIITGWITREVGRQPWLIWGILRTEDAASPLPAGSVWFSNLAFIAMFAALFLVFLHLAGRILKAGPPEAGPPAKGRAQS